MRGSEDRHQHLDISSIKVRLVENGTDGLVAWASCVIADAVKLDNIAIRRGRDGSLFLTYPAKLAAGGEKYNYHHPVTVEAADAIQKAVLDRLAVFSVAGAAISSSGKTEH